MSTEKTQTGNLKIEAFSLADLLQEVQQGVLDGYRLDYTSNDLHSFGSGSYFYAGMAPAKAESKKEDSTPKTEQKQEVVATEKEEEAPRKTAGRKPKGQ